MDVESLFHTVFYYDEPGYDPCRQKVICKTLENTVNPVADAIIMNPAAVQPCWIIRSS
jgi:hypothetical protein